MYAVTLMPENVKYQKVSILKDAKLTYMPSLAQKVKSTLKPRWPTGAAYALSICT